MGGLEKMMKGQIRRKSNVARNEKFEKNEKSGVSLIALVITIIVVIILAAIAFGTSTRTITNANYSDYVNNVSEVYNAFHRRAVTIKGQEAARGNNVTDAQVYDYLAKNGQTQDDFLVRADLPDYTIIEDEEQIGMKLPKMVVESGTGKMVTIKYAVTNAGDIFTWPPFDYEEGYKINDNDNAETKLSTTISVKGNSLGIKLDTNTGELLDSIAENSIKNLVKTGELKIGDYINYNTFLTAKNYTSPENANGSGDQELSANTSVGWRVIYMDNSKIWITPASPVSTVKLMGARGYINGPAELHKICRELYSSSSLGTTASSMTIEDLETALGATSDGATKLTQAKARYKRTIDSVDYKIGDTKNNYTNYNYWIENNNGVTGGTAGDTIPGTSLTYYKASSASPITATQTYYNYNPGSINSAVATALGGSYGWLASECVPLNSNYANFDVRGVSSSNLGADIMCYSFGITGSSSYGVRPLVSLSSRLQLDAGDTSSHTSQTNAWKILN